MNLIEGVVGLLICIILIGAVGSFAIFQDVDPVGGSVSGSGLIGYGLQFFEDQDLTVELMNIDWGVLEPGESRNKILYVLNGRDEMIQLGMSCQDWDPVEAENFIFLSWDYLGQLLNWNQYVSVVFTLSVSEEISGIDSFNFNITVYQL